MRVQSISNITDILKIISKCSLFTTREKNHKIITLRNDPNQKVIGVASFLENKPYDAGNQPHVRKGDSYPCDIIKNVFLEF